MLELGAMQQQRLESVPAGKPCVPLRGAAAYCNYCQECRNQTHYEGADAIKQRPLTVTFWHYYADFGSTMLELAQFVHK
jgi:hypothetical protein